MADRGDFAILLRAWRDRLRPSAVGFPDGQGRRALGLRREELALLAGLSVDYVVRLEQGRAENPSEQVVAALARVLQLSDAERDQLYLAAGIPVPLPATVPRHIPGSIQRLLSRLPDVAIAVYSADWTVITSNAAWVALLGWPAEGEQNLVVRQFEGTAPDVVRNSEDTERFERSLVSDLRTASIRYPNDPALRALVQGLRDSNPRFETMWSDVEVVDYFSKSKTFIHPLVGPVTLECDALTVSGTDLRVIAYTAEPGSEAASKFDLILTLGTQTMA